MGKAQFLSSLIGGIHRLFPKGGAGMGCIPPLSCLAAPEVTLAGEMLSPPGLKTEKAGNGK